MSGHQVLGALILAGLLIAALTFGVRDQGWRFTIAMLLGCMAIGTLAALGINLLTGAI